MRSVLSGTRIKSNICSINPRNPHILIIHTQNPKENTGKLITATSKNDFMLWPLGIYLGMQIYCKIEK